MNETENTATTVASVDGSQEPAAATSGEGKTATLVAGEMSKYNDVESLLKGKAEADKFIETLKKENQELRDKLTRSENIENFRKELLNMQENNDITSTNESTNSYSAEEIQELALKAMLQREADKTAEGNLQASLDLAKAAFGDEAENKLTAKASEMGTTVEDLKEMAKKSPKMFNALMGLQAPKASQVDFSDLGRAPVSASSAVKSEGLMETFRKNPSIARDARQMAQLFDKAAADPSILDELAW